MCRDCRKRWRWGYFYLVDNVSWWDTIGVCDGNGQSREDAMMLIKGRRCEFALDEGRYEGVTFRAEASRRPDAKQNAQFKIPHVTNTNGKSRAITLEMASEVFSKT